MNRSRITRRQIEYLQVIWELQSLRNDLPVHYSEVASELSVTADSAYSVLSALEAKKCVVSHYHLPKARKSRTVRVYELTARGKQALAENGE